MHENFFFRWLTFDDCTLQTILYKNNPELYGLYYIKPLTSAVVLAPGNCCLLGLGGAGVAHYLAQKISSYTIDAVEINPVVVDYAQQFFTTDILSNLNIYCQNANIFVRHHEEKKYHHVLVDLSVRECMPADCYTANFFMNCKNLLKHNGVLAVNIAAANQQMQIFKWISALFGSQATITVNVRYSANIILLASTKKSINAIIANAPKHYQARWDSQLGLILTY